MFLGAVNHYIPGFIDESGSVNNNNNNNNNKKKKQCFCIVAGLSHRKLEFDPRPIQVDFVVEKVALGQSFLQELRSSPSISSFQRCSIVILRSSRAYVTQS